MSTVLYVHSSDEMYGADRVLLQLIEHLDREIYHPIVVLPNDLAYTGLLSKALVEQGIEVIHYPTAVLRRKYFSLTGILQYLYRLIRSTFYLGSLIRRNHIDLVHSNTLAVIPGALAARLTGRPHVWHVHEILTRPKALEKLTAWLAPRLSARVVAVSVAVRDHLIQTDSQNAAKAIVIHNGVDPACFEVPEQAREGVRASWGITNDQVLIGMVGRVSALKGQAYLADVAERVVERCPQARFAFVGGTLPGQEANLDLLKSRVSHGALAGRAVVSDFRNDMPAVYAAFDILVLPSQEPESFPLVILEAMASCRPVVANAVGGVLELVEPSETGFLVANGNKAEMADRIIWLIEHPKERRQMGNQGREQVEANYSLDRFARNWMAQYHDLLNGREPENA